MRPLALNSNGSQTSAATRLENPGDNYDSDTDSDIPDLLSEDEDVGSDIADSLSQEEDTPCRKEATMPSTPLEHLQEKAFAPPENTVSLAGQHSPNCGDYCLCERQERRKFFAPMDLEPVFRLHLCQHQRYTQLQLRPLWVLVSQHMV